MELKEYIDLELGHLRHDLEREVTAHKDHHATNGVALALARDIIERRLDILNHFQSRMEALTKDFVPREIHLLMETRLRQLESESSNYHGRLWAFGVAISAVVTVLAIGIQLLLR